MCSLLLLMSRLKKTAVLLKLCMSHNIPRAGGLLCQPPGMGFLHCCELFWCMLQPCERQLQYAQCMLAGHSHFHMSKRQPDWSCKVYTCHTVCSGAASSCERRSTRASARRPRQPVRTGGYGSRVVSWQPHAKLLKPLGM